MVDFTYVPTWSGMAFTASVTDVVSRRIVGWRKMDPIPTDIPLDALEMALWVRDRAGQDITGVIQHSDAGVQYIAIRCCWSDCNGRACGDNLDDRARLIRWRGCLARWSSWSRAGGALGQAARSFCRCTHRLASCGSCVARHRRALCAGSEPLNFGLHEAVSARSSGYIRAEDFLAGQKGWSSSGRFQTPAITGRLEFRKEPATERPRNRSDFRGFFMCYVSGHL